jgi:hypothetical protein
MCRQLRRTLIVKLRFRETSWPISACFAHISCGETGYVAIRQGMNVAFLFVFLSLQDGEKITFSTSLSAFPVA